MNKMNLVRGWGGGFFFFFFKQKTAYEMCGRDWSSDVCSSDLTHANETLPLPKLALLYVYTNIRNQYVKHASLIAVVAIRLCYRIICSSMVLTSAVYLNIAFGYIL